MGFDFAFPKVLYSPGGKSEKPKDTTIGTTLICCRVFSSTSREEGGIVRSQMQIVMLKMPRASFSSPSVKTLIDMAVGQNLRYLFWDDYPPKVVYFKGFWDVHRGTGVLTHSHIPEADLKRNTSLPRCAFHAPRKVTAWHLQVLQPASFEDDKS